MNLPSETDETKLDDDGGTYIAFVFADCCVHNHTHTRVFFFFYFCQYFSSSLKQYFIFLTKTVCARAQRHAHEDAAFGSVFGGMS